MAPYVAVFVAVHLLCAAAFGSFTIWRESSGGIVGGGFGVLAIWGGVWALSALFARRRRVPPTRGELMLLYGLCCGYLLTYDSVVLLLGHRVLIFQPTFQWFWGGWVSLPVSAAILLFLLPSELKRATKGSVDPSSNNRWRGP